MTERPIAEELADLRKLDFVALRLRYHEVFGRATRSKSPELIFRRIAWQIQANRFGGLSDVAKAKLAELQEPLGLKTEVRAILPTKARLPAGQVISREWRNQRIEVLVTEDGFRWNGAPYTSLSAVAKAITGVAWNGYVFFGLKVRVRK